MSGLLSLTTFAPIVGVVVILAARALHGAGEKTDALAKWIALVTTLVTFGLSIILTAQFDPKNPGFQFVEDVAWFAGLHYRMGVDGISVLFVLLTAFLLPICIIASWKSVEKRVVEYLIAFLVLETLVIGVFCALDLVLFYLFFEAGPCQGIRRLSDFLTAKVEQGARLVGDAGRTMTEIVATGPRQARPASYRVMPSRIACSAAGQPRYSVSIAACRSRDATFSMGWRWPCRGWRRHWRIKCCCCPGVTGSRPLACCCSMSGMSPRRNISFNRPRKNPAMQRVWSA